MKQKTVSNVHILFLCIFILLQTSSFNAMAPITTTITTGLSTLSTTYPFASLAITVGKAIGVSIASLGSYLAHKKNSRKPYKCFSPQENTNTTTHSSTTCYPLSSLEQEQLQGCQIVVENHSPGCTLTIDPSIHTQVHFEKENPKAEASNKRYTGPYYTRTEDWIKEHPFGQKIKDSLIRSPYTNQGKRAYEVTKNIDNCDGFKKK